MNEFAECLQRMFAQYQQESTAVVKQKIVGLSGWLTPDVLCVGPNKEWALLCFENEAGIQNAFNAVFSEIPLEDRQAGEVFTGKKYWFIVLPPVTRPEDPMHQLGFMGWKRRIA